jgi:phosphate transport system substrate-binding protein
MKPLLFALTMLAMACGSKQASPAGSDPAARPPVAATAVSADIRPKKALSKVEVTWVGCEVTKRAFMDELVKAYEAQTGIQVVLGGGGATRGIRDVASRLANLGGTCRNPLDVESERDAVLLPIAWDALVIVVHKDNPLTEITREQVAQVFTRKVTRWSHLNPAADDVEIKLHVREGKVSGVGYMERLLLFHDLELDYGPNCCSHKSTEPLEAALAKDPHGIGISGISSAARQPGLKMLTLDGVRPSAANLINGKYELIRPLYLTIHKDHTKSGPAADFVKFALSAKGQQVIAATGTVPMAKIGDELFDRFYAKVEKAQLQIAQLQAGRKVMNSMVDLSLEELGSINVVEIQPGK